MQVGNNDTIILGGLIREVERTLKNRVPGISYIPLVGNLFTSSTREREKVDLMVFLTPSIIETPRQASEATFDVTVGQPALSEGELKTLIKNYEEFQKSNKQEGVSQGSMRLSSGDIFPPRAQDGPEADASQPDGQQSEGR